MVDCLTGIFGKVTADAVAKELAVVDQLGKPAPAVLDEPSFCHNESRVVKNN
jgi:hypothetical protein